MGIIEYLFFPSWFCDVLEVLNMVHGFLVRSQVSWTVCVPGVHHIELSYNSICKCYILQLEMSNVLTARWGKSSFHVVMASSNTLMSWTEPGHPARTNVKIMSKSQAAMTFYVVRPLRHKCCTNLLAGTTQGMWLPSITPMQSLNSG
jgi:hypothetical protein